MTLWKREKRSTSVICTGQLIEGGVLSVAGEQIHYRDCYFRSSTIRVHPDTRHPVFIDCIFEDCLVDAPPAALFKCFVKEQEAA